MQPSAGTRLAEQQIRRAFRFAVGTVFVLSGVTLWSCTHLALEGHSLSFWIGTTSVAMAWASIICSYTTMERTLVALGTSEKRVLTLLHKLSSVAEQTADSVLITDRDGKIEYVNKAFEKITGYAKQEVLGQTPRVLKSGRHNEVFYRNMWKIVLGGESFHATLVNRKKGGDLFHSEKTISPLFSPTGEITSFVSTDRDITERIRAEEEARRLTLRFKEIFDFSTDGIVYLALDGTLLDANPAYRRMSGYSRDELTRLRYQDIVPPETHEMGEGLVARVIHEGGLVECEAECFHKSGQHLPVLLTMFAVRDCEDQITALAAFVKDNTERKSTERKLSESMTELARSNAELEQFASIASHDLQEPLRMVTSYLRLIEVKNAGKLDADSLEYLGYAKDGAIRLKAMILSLLSYARVGKDLKLVLTDSDQVVKNVLGSLRVQIAESGACVETCPLPILSTSPALLEQIFQNLISNALKYRSEKALKIVIRAGRGDAKWTFSVEDNGTGIAIESQSRVFQLFHRFHEKQISGSGIGLATCKKIVERLGGKIWFQSEPGVGSTFFFSLPAKAEVPLTPELSIDGRLLPTT